MAGSDVRADAFDAVAAGYDDDFTRSPTGRLQRARVHAYVAEHVPQGADALELGCGTGEDALFLAGRGLRVLATDASLEMLAVARAKAAAQGAQVRFLELDLRELEAWDTSERFDLLFSNFGALNCLAPDELADVGRAAARLLRPGGHAVLVVMPRVCLWELAYFGARLRLPSALRRLAGGPVAAALGATRVPTWYHSPGALRRAFGAEFRHVGQLPVGLCLPPSYLDRVFTRRQRLLAGLDRLERAAGIGVLAGLADHCLVHLQRE